MSDDNIQSLEVAYGESNQTWINRCAPEIERRISNLEYYGKRISERLTALETAVRPAEDYRDPNVPYAPHPAYTVAAGWKDKHDQQMERASGLEKELGTVREQLREKTDLLHKGTADYRAQYRRAEANQAAADTLDRLRQGEAVGQDRLLHVSLPGELATLRAERDALAAELAEVDAARVAAEDLANANATDVGILERRLAELDRTRPQYPPHTPGMTCTINGEPCIWTAVDTINSLRRDAERWQTWVEMLGAEFLQHAWTGKVDAAIAAEAAKEEASYGRE